MAEDDEITGRVQLVYTFCNNESNARGTYVEYSYTRSHAQYYHTVLNDTWPKRLNDQKRNNVINNSSPKVYI